MSAINNNKIIVGNSYFTGLLNKKVAHLPCKFELHRFAPYAGDGLESREAQLYKKCGPHFFCRDTQVFLPSGGVYVPRIFKYDPLPWLVKGLLPPEMSHFLANKINVIGRGFYPEEQEEARKFLRGRFPLKLGHSVLDGGNVFLFQNRAIIGEISL